MKYFPASLNVKNRHCWVIGNDQEAVWKTAGLAEAGAHVTVIAPQFSSDALKEFNRCGAHVLERDFHLDDLTDQFFVILSAKEDPALCEKVWNDCQKKRILICSIDQPKFCDVVNASVYRNGHLMVTISTDGAAPAVSRQMRLGLQSSLKEIPIDEFLEDLAQLRIRLEKEIKDPEERRRQLLAAVDGFKFNTDVSFPPTWKSKRKK